VGPVGDSADILRVEQCEVWPCIYYQNSAHEKSDSVDHVFNVKGAEVRVKIGFHHKSPDETITVEPLDAEVIADPEYAEVADGEDIYVNIILPCC